MMNIIRAWKDEEYRMSLSDEERSLLPDNPAGPMELSDADLDSVVGGLIGPTGIVCIFTVGQCGGAPSGVIACSGILCQQ
jgi:mersacidin/lichenicidin family type 2 lantibiotic